MTGSIKMDISAVLRSAAPLETLGVYRAIEQELGALLWEEFDQLLNETPQWTGTAAASWNMAITGIATGKTLGEGGVRKQKELSRKNALQKGHGAAVNIARSENASFKKDMNGGLFHRNSALPRGAIGIWNNSESIKTAEGGPLRAENKPPGAFQRFEARIGELTIDLRNRNYKV